MINDEHPQSQLLIMKNLAKLTFGLFAFMLLFTACSKDDDEITQKVAKEITRDDLMNYMIVDEFLAKPEYQNQLGTKPYLFATYIKEDNNDGKIYAFSKGWFASVFYNLEQDEALTYDANTGITKLKTKWGYYELTRDSNEQIIVKGNHHDPNNPYTYWFTSNYTQLVKTDGKVYDNSTYKAVENLTGFYRFSIDFWRYKQDAVPIEGELTWPYYLNHRNVWTGQDGGTEKLHNVFIAIPKGNGWKGNHKDKDILLVNTGKTMTTGNVVVCEKM